MEMVQIYVTTLKNEFFYGRNWPTITSNKFISQLNTTKAIDAAHTESNDHSVERVL